MLLILFIVSLVTSFFLGVSVGNAGVSEYLRWQIHFLEKELHTARFRAHKWERAAGYNEMYSHHQEFLQALYKKLQEIEREENKK